MITLNYTKTGQAFPDYAVEEIAMQFRDGDWIDFSTENMCLAVRCLVKEGKLTNVELRHEGAFVGVVNADGCVVCFNEHGDMVTWPIGFCDTSEKLIGRILFDH